MISELCHSKAEPVYITKNGYGDLVIMSMETFEAMLEERSTDHAIAAAEAEYAETGELLDFRLFGGSILDKYRVMLLPRAS